MTTTIHSNGSKWAGEAPDTIQNLIAVLARETLDPKFEAYGNFAYVSGDGKARFFGNFLTVSHVFRIDSDDPEIIEDLTLAIRRNQLTPAYREARRQAGIDAKLARDEAKRCEMLGAIVRVLVRPESEPITGEERHVLASMIQCEFDTREPEPPLEIRAAVLEAARARYANDDLTINDAEAVIDVSHSVDETEVEGYWVEAYVYVSAADVDELCICAERDDDKPHAEGCPLGGAPKHG